MNGVSRQQRAQSVQIPCEFCGSSIHSQFYNSHLNICSKDPLVLNVDRAGIPCEVCNTRVPFEEYSQHLGLHSEPEENEPEENEPEDDDYSEISETDAQILERQIRFQPPSENDMDIEPEARENFPIREVPRGMRRIAFPSEELFDTLFAGPRINRPGIIQFDGLNELLTRIVAPMQQYNHARIIYDEGPELQQPQEQGFKKEELDRNFITAKYDKKKSKDLQEENKKCMICLSEFENGEKLRFLECCHRFHKDCIDHWMKTKTTCPVCKADFKDFEAE